MISLTSLLKEGKGEDRIMSIASRTEEQEFLEKIPLLKEKFRVLDNSPLLKQGFEKFMLNYTKSRPQNIEYLFPILDAFDGPMQVKGTTHFSGQVAKLAENLCKIQVKNVGRAELFLVLAVKDMGMPSGTADFDLQWKNEKWEVKEISRTQRGFDLAKKGRVTNYPEIFKFYESVEKLDEITERLKDETVRKELEEFSPDVVNELDKYLKPLSTKKNAVHSLRSSILSSEISKSARDYFSKLSQSINDVLRSIQKANQSKFTRVSFSGKASKTKASRIVPLDPEKVKKGIVSIDYLEEDTKEIIEMLTELPSFQIDADLERSLGIIASQIKEKLYNFIFMTNDTLDIFPIPEEELENDIEYIQVSRGTLLMKVGQEAFAKRVGGGTNKKIGNI